MNQITRNQVLPKVVASERNAQALGDEALSESQFLALDACWKPVSVSSDEVEHVTRPYRQVRTPVAAVETLTHKNVRERLPVMLATHGTKPFRLNAPTSTGKTTKIPYYIFDITSKPVLVVEPQVDYAYSAFRFNAEKPHLRTSFVCGDEVFGDCTGVVYTTAETVLKKAVSDTAWFSQFGTIYLDEAHEVTAEYYALRVFVYDALKFMIRIFASATFDSVSVENLGRVFDVEEREMEDIPQSLWREKDDGNQPWSPNRINSRTLVFCETKELQQSLKNWYESEGIPALSFDDLGGKEAVDLCNRFLTYYHGHACVVLSGASLQTGHNFCFDVVIDCGTRSIPQINLGERRITTRVRNLMRHEKIQRAGRLGRMTSGVYYSPNIQFTPYVEIEGYNKVHAYLWLKLLGYQPLKDFDKVRAVMEPCSYLTCVHLLGTHVHPLILRPYITDDGLFFRNVKSVVDKLYPPGTKVRYSGDAIDPSDNEQWFDITIEGHYFEDGVERVTKVPLRPGLKPVEKTIKYVALRVLTWTGLMRYGNFVSPVDKSIDRSYGYETSRVTWNVDQPLLGSSDHASGLVNVNESESQHDEDSENIKNLSVADELSCERRHPAFTDTCVKASEGAGRQLSIHSLNSDGVRPLVRQHDFESSRDSRSSGEFVSTTRGYRPLSDASLESVVTRFSDSLLSILDRLERLERGAFSYDDGKARDSSSRRGNLIACDDFDGAGRTNCEVSQVRGANRHQEGYRTGGTSPSVVELLSQTDVVRGQVLCLSETAIDSSEFLVCDFEDESKALAVLKGQINLYGLQAAERVECVISVVKYWNKLNFERGRLKAHLDRSRLEQLSSGWSSYLSKKYQTRNISTLLTRCDNQLAGFQRLIVTLMQMDYHFYKLPEFTVDRKTKRCSDVIQRLHRLGDGNGGDTSSTLRGRHLMSQFRRELMTRDVVRQRLVDLKPLVRLFVRLKPSLGVILDCGLKFVGQAVRCSNQFGDQVIVSLDHVTRGESYFSSGGVVEPFVPLLVDPERDRSVMHPDFDDPGVSLTIRSPEDGEWVYLVWLMPFSQLVSRRITVHHLYAIYVELSYYRDLDELDRGTRRMLESLHSLIQETYGDIYDNAEGVDTRGRLSPSLYEKFWNNFEVYALGPVRIRTIDYDTRGLYMVKTLPGMSGAAVVALSDGALVGSHQGEYVDSPNMSFCQCY